MSDIEKKAKVFSEVVENYKKNSLNLNELSRYHSLSEQNFDKIIGNLEDAIQSDIKDISRISPIFDKILKPLKKVVK